ncbi:MAG: tetratricopeptide repeat protein [Opitutaceae bacterium]|jgi:outer membrane protein assembly factor BamD|nr:tetratricopeptide repeat protein [Opitutaceae bacterium]
MNRRLFSPFAISLALLISALALHAQPRPFPGGGGPGGHGPRPGAPHHAATIALDWAAETGWVIATPGVPAPADEASVAALALMNDARAREEKGDRTGALTRYEKVVKRHPNTLYASEALYRAARLRQERRQYTKAFTHYNDLLQRYPGNPHFDDLVRQQYAIASDLIAGKRPLYWGWLPGFKARDEGIRLMATVIRNAPYSDIAPQALLTIARGRQQQREPDEAIDALDHLINTYADSKQAPDAYLDIAKAYAGLVQGPAYDQAATRQSANYYEDYLILFPNGAQVAGAEKGRDEMKAVLAQNKLNAGDFYYHKRDNLRAARVLYNEAITTFPKSSVAETARARLELVAETERQRRVRSENRIAIGDYYYNRGMPGAALIFYNEAAAIKPDNETVGKARERAARARKALAPVTTAAARQAAAGGGVSAE